MAQLVQPTAPTAPAHSASQQPARVASGGDDRTTADRVLDAAEAGFAERGFAGTSLRDVATEVGIRIPSLYNHFASKADLYQAVLSRAIGEIQGVLDRVGRGELSNDARDVIGALMQVFQARPHIPRLLQYELLSGGERLALVLDDSVRPALVRGAEMLEQAGAGSRWKSQDRPLLLLAFYNLLIGHFTSAPIYQVLTGQDPHAPEAIDRQVEFFGQLVKVLVGTEQSI